jgi:predicted DNA-binding transcriptional regulator AlpA
MDLLAEKMRLLTTQDLAELLRVAPATVKDWRQPRSGRKGPRPVRLGRRTVRYSVKDVQSWLAAKRRVKR